MPKSNLWAEPPESKTGVEEYVAGLLDSIRRKLRVEKGQEFVRSWIDTVTSYSLAEIAEKFFDILGGSFGFFRKLKEIGVKIWRGEVVTRKDIWELCKQAVRWFLSVVSGVPFPDLDSIREFLLETYRKLFPKQKTYAEAAFEVDSLLACTA